ncbi:hypothetical protein D3C76_1359760 [compost metagenome]
MNEFSRLIGFADNLPVNLAICVLAFAVIFNLDSQAVASDRHIRASARINAVCRNRGWRVKITRFHGYGLEGLALRYLDGSGV